MKVQQRLRVAAGLLHAAALVGAASMLLAPAAGMARSVSESREEEAGRIAPFADRVGRYGELLVLRAANGERVVLVRSPDDCDHDGCIWYSFEDAVEHLKSFLVQIYYYEGDEYLLIDRRDGRQTRVAERPHPDPEGRRFLATRTDEMFGDVMQMWLMTLKGPALEFAYEPLVSVCFAAWRALADVELVQGECDGDSAGTAGDGYHLLHKDDGWRLVGPGVDLLIPAATASAPE